MAFISSNQNNLQLEYLNKWFTAVKGMNMINLSIDKNSVVGTFTKEDLKRYLKDITSEANQKNLRKISRSLYLSSSHYRTLINYHSTLFNFDYVVDPYNLNPDDVKDRDKYKKAYMRSVDYIEKLNIKKESLKIRFNSYLDGVFYGYVRESKDNAYIQQFSPDNCKLTFVNYETGQLGYSFNFNIFSGKEDLLNTYPDEFTEIWRTIKNNKGSNKSSWVKIDSPNAICIKPNPDFHPIPPFVGVFDGILDIADFKALNKGKEEIGNYQLIHHQIPMKNSEKAELNDFLISEDFVRMFHENISNNLPDQVAVVTTPMKLDAIKFERDSVDKNKVSEATSQYWNEAGISELLFGNNNSSAALKYSIMADEASLSSMVTDIQAWYNEFIKVNIKGIYKFRIRVLLTTVFNVSDYFKNRLNAGQYGLPVKNELGAILGMSPSTVYVGTFLENDVLDLVNKLIPLSSSHTISDPLKNGGAPEKSDEELSDKGERTRENGNI